MSLLAKLVAPFSDLVRWGEPWDLEDDDPLYEQADDPIIGWA